MALDPKIHAREMRRLERQFDAMERFAPPLRRPLSVVRARGWWIVRLPIGLLFMLGGIASILPFLGLWMLPLGLLLLAIDLPFLRGPIGGAMIRGRRKINLWKRKYRNASRRDE